MNSLVVRPQSQAAPGHYGRIASWSFSYTYLWRRLRQPRKPTTASRSTGYPNWSLGALDQLHG